MTGQISSAFRMMYSLFRNVADSLNKVVSSGSEISFEGLLAIVYLTNGYTHTKDLAIGRPLIRFSNIES